MKGEIKSLQFSGCLFNILAGVGKQNKKKVYLHVSLKKLIYWFFNKTNAIPNSQTNQCLSGINYIFEIEFGFITTETQT